MEKTMEVFPRGPFSVFHPSGHLYEGGIIADGTYTGVMYLLANSTILNDMVTLEENEGSFNTVCVLYAGETDLEYILPVCTAVVTLLDPSLSPDEFSDMFVETISGGSCRADRLESEYYPVDDSTCMILYRTLD